MNESYTYYAFVSHSHRDAKWATWIQNALERYRLPSSVRKAVGKPLPKRLAPVFRDATDLGSCQLVEGLHRELEASRFLIVICSPDSAKPNAEGKHFGQQVLLLWWQKDRVEYYTESEIFLCLALPMVTTLANAFGLRQSPNNGKLLGLLEIEEFAVLVGRT